ncbi:hypothetical protein [Butyrivibrio hungatei]|nr:hypothetical protein [Butyrivibrio hungatei]
MPGSTASADGYEDWSWIAGTTADGTLEAGVDISATSNDTNTGDDAEPNKTPSSIEKIMASLVFSIGTQISRTLNAVPGVPMNITSIVMGKIATGGNSFFTFDLTDGNVYGGIGAYLYVTLQQLALTFVFAVSLFSVVKAMWKGDSKAGQFLKDNIVAFAGAMICLFVMPNIVDAVCIIRDNLSIVMYNTLTGLAPSLNFANGIEAGYKKLYEDSSTFVNALAYALVCSLPLTYVFSYIKIAIMQLILFGLFPMFVFAGFLDNKQSLGQWCVTFFTNCFVPVIDIALMLLPSILLSAMSEASGVSSDFKGSFVQGLITYIMYQAIVPTRNQILSMLGNKWGISNGKGLIGFAGGIAAAAKGAITGAAVIAGGIKSGVDRHRARKEEANQEKESSKAKNEAADKLEVKANAPIPSAKEDEARGKHNNDGTETGLSVVPGRNESSAPENGGDDTNNIGEESDKPDKLGDRYSAAFDTNDLQVVNSPSKHSDDEGSDTSEKFEDSNDSESNTNGFGSSINNDIPHGSETSGASGDDIYNNVLADSVVTGEDVEKAMAGDNGELSKDAKSISENSSSEDINFNSKRYANLKTMDNMRDKISAIDEGNAKLSALNAKDKLELHQNERAIRDFESKKPSKMSASDIEGLKKRNDTLKANIEKRSDAIGIANSAKTILNQEVSRRSGIEKEYGQHDKGRTFSDASSFQSQLKTEANERKIASFSSYVDKRASGGALSPSQRIEVEKAAERRQIYAKAFSTVDKAAVMTGAAVGMIASVGATTDAEYFHGADSSAGKIYHTAKQYVASGASEVFGETMADGVGAVVSAGKAAHKANGEYKQAKVERKAQQMGINLGQIARK